jgi:two-component system, OmpR family, osmolarity sensor histidine kinase EnvZ
MTFRWLKTYAPRSLMGRAALIMLLPIVTIQLVVSVVFIQRHYENVTERMTRNIMLDIDYIVGRIADAPDLPAARDALRDPLAALDIDVSFTPGPRRTGASGTIFRDARSSRRCRTCPA